MNEETIESLKLSLASFKGKYTAAAASAKELQKENLSLSARLKETEKSLAWCHDALLTLNLENLQLKDIIKELEEAG